MTKITYCSGKKTTIKIKGHSMAERIGDNDLCCAAVSMLCCTLVDTINRLNLKKSETVLKDAYVYISFPINSLRSVYALFAVKTIINGFRLLTEKYPENVYVSKQKEVKANEYIYN